MKQEGDYLQTEGKDFQPLEIKMRQGRESTEDEKQIDYSENGTKERDWCKYIRKDQTEIHFVILRKTIEEFIIFIAGATYNGSRSILSFLRKSVKRNTKKMIKEKRSDLNDMI